MATKTAHDRKQVIIVLIRPSNYDDEGYVVRYVRGVFPSNTLSCLRSLTMSFVDDWRRDRNIHIEIETRDDLVERIPYDALARENGKPGRRVITVVAGVQTNQFPRASDIALKLADRGVKVLIGGFHVSGMMTMFDEPSPAMQRLMDAGVTLVAGEAEHCWESILLDVVEEREKPLYRMQGYPDISHVPVPQADPGTMRRFAVPNMGTIDCSRGCPFNCSFCTIINVQGKKMRNRCAESVLKTMRENHARGVDRYFFTDDNFSRNPEWEPIFDGLIGMREDEGIEIDFVMQVDTACDSIPGFIDKARRAGCSTVFIGMESINPRNLEAAGKKQNKVENYASYIRAWHDVGVQCHVGYIIGFPFDTPESVRHDIRTLKNDIKADLASFFILTPLPGSRDHYQLVSSGTDIDPDLNKYDSFHTVMDHPRMSREELYKTYLDAWTSFYDFDNLKIILIRARENGFWRTSMFTMMWYKNSLLEPRHPMVGGFIRRKDRTDVRPGTPVMNPGAFTLRRARELVSGAKRRMALFSELQELWWLTRKTDEPTFIFNRDFNEILYDAKIRLSELDINGPYAKWCADAHAVIASLPEQIRDYYSSNCDLISERARRRFNKLIEDVNAFLGAVTISDYCRMGTGFFSRYLSNTISMAEEFTVRPLAQRRKIKRCRALTRERAKNGKFLSLFATLPRYVFSLIRDIRLSMTFTVQFFSKIR